MADKAMSDPYANPEGPGTSLDPAIALNAAQGAVTAGVPGAATPDFLFPENYDTTFRRSWGDRLTYHIGLGYLVGARRPNNRRLHASLRQSYPRLWRLAPLLHPPSGAAVHRLTPALWRCGAPPHTRSIVLHAALT